jgi:ribosome biogenesis GTPase A
MPGVLWPKFDDTVIGENLAATGAIKDAILDTESLAGILCSRLVRIAPELFCARYKLGDATPLLELKPYELLELVGRKRGFLISGGEVDTERAAGILLEEFRSGKIGRITLDVPPTKGDSNYADA